MRPPVPVFLLLVLLLAACSSIGGSPTPLPTIVLDVGGAESEPGTPAAGDVSASGQVISPLEARLAFGQGGIVQAVPVAVGDSVRAGDVLVELDSTLAQLELDRAQRILRELTSEAAIAAAEQAVALAQEEQDKAQKKVNALSYPRATEELIDNLKAKVTLARRELAEATDNFNQVRDLPSYDPARANAVVRMTQAQITLNTLVGNYNWYTGEPSEIDVALRYANLKAATAAVQEAQWYVAALRGEPIPDEASGAKLSELQQARGALAAAEANLAATRLTSPVDGVVGLVALEPGEYALPGTTVVIVTNLDRLQVETTDLSELDLSGVGIGQPATIDIEALGASAPGHVAAISPVPQTLGGDVVYTVILDLDEIPDGLRPGMTVTVFFGPLP